MLSQLAKLASRLDSVGLTKEADVLDAFIKRAADGDYSEVSGEYHPDAEEEEKLFGQWYDQEVRGAYQAESLPDLEETEDLTPGDGSDLAADKMMLNRIFDTIGTDEDIANMNADDVSLAIRETLRNLWPFIHGKLKP